MAYRDPPRVPRVPLYPIQLDFCIITDLLYILMGDSKAPGRSLSESTGLISHAASVKIDWPIFALASELEHFGCLTHW